MPPPRQIGLIRYLTIGLIRYLKQEHDVVSLLLMLDIIIYFIPFLDFISLVLLNP